MNAVYLLSEIGMVSLFGICLVFAWRNRKHDNARDLSLLVSSAIFAAIFENLNVIQVSGRGSYSYNSGFHAFVGEVPLFVVLAWSVILWTAMQIGDATRLQWPQKIACDALLATLLDLGFDATAIRHGFWNWHGVAFDQAWFGVPAGNFFGWLFVSLVFSLSVRTLDWLIQHRTIGASFRCCVQIVAVPPLGFGLYRALENTNNALLKMGGWNPQNPQTDTLALTVFAIQFLALTLWVLWQKRAKTEHPNARNANSEIANAENANAKNANIEYSIYRKSVLAFAHACRVSFHVFAVLGLLALPFSPLLAQQKPALLAVAGFVGVVDWFFVRRLLRRTI